MGCISPNTQYEFRYNNANIIGGTESVTGAGCPAYDSNLEAEAYSQAKDRFREYLRHNSALACKEGCVQHTATDWIEVPGLDEQIKVKRIFFKTVCPDENGKPRTCLYSFEVIFFYTVWQRTVTCIPSLSGPNDFYLEPIALDGKCERE